MDVDGKRDSPHIFKTEDRTILYRFLEPHVHFIHCLQTIKTDMQIVEAFPDSWILFYLKDNWNDTIRVQTQANEYVLNKNLAVLLPPYSIIRWHLNAGYNEWWAYRSVQALPEHFGSEPLLFPWNPEWQFDSSEQIIAKLTSLKHRATSLPSEFNKSERAIQVKRNIDLKFHENITLQELISQDPSSLSTFSHAFKNCYGLSPVQYRNQLRMHFSIIKMNFENQGVTESCFASGFGDFSRFYRNMRSYFNSHPSCFLPKKSISYSKTEI